MKIPNLKEHFTKHPACEYIGHKKRVYSLDWNFSGNRLASGSADGSIRLWNLEGSLFEKSSELKGNTDSIYCLKWLTDHILITTSSDKYIRWYDIRLSNKPIHSEKLKIGCRYIAVKTNKISTQSNSIYAVSNKDEDMISIYDYSAQSTHSTQAIQPFKQIQFKTKVNEFAFDYIDELLIVTSAFTGSMYLYSSDSFELIHSVELQSPPFHCISFARNNKVFATGGGDSLVSLWDEEIIAYKVIKKTDYSVKQVQFDSSSLYLCVTYDEGSMDVFDVETGENVYSIGVKTLFNCVSWHPKCCLLAYCLDEKSKSNEEGGVMLIGLK